MQIYASFIFSLLKLSKINIHKKFKIMQPFSLTPPVQSNLPQETLSSTISTVKTEESKEPQKATGNGTGLSLSTRVRTIAANSSSMSALLSSYSEEGEEPKKIIRRKKKKGEEWTQDEKLTLMKWVIEENYNEALKNNRVLSIGSLVCSEKMFKHYPKWKNELKRTVASLYIQCLKLLKKQSFMDSLSDFILSFNSKLTALIAVTASSSSNSSTTSSVSTSSLSERISKKKSPKTKKTNPRKNAKGNSEWTLEEEQRLMKWVIEENYNEAIKNNRTFSISNLISTPKLFESYPLELNPLKRKIVPLYMRCRTLKANQSFMDSLGDFITSLGSRRTTIVASSSSARPIRALASTSSSSQPVNTRSSSRMKKRQVDNPILEDSSILDASKKSKTTTENPVEVEDPLGSTLSSVFPIMPASSDLRLVSTSTNSFIDCQTFDEWLKSIV